MAEEFKRYKPGDTFTHQMLEFVAHHDSGDESCEHCVGHIKESVCDMLPAGCGNDEIVWKPSNESAKTLAALIKLDAI